MDATPCDRTADNSSVVKEDGSSVPIQQKHGERVIEKGCGRPTPIQTYGQTGATLHANRVLRDNIGIDRLCGGRNMWCMDMQQGLEIRKPVVCGGGSTQIICPSRSHGNDWEKSFRLDGFYEPIIELCLTHLGLGVLDPHCQMTYSPC